METPKRYMGCPKCANILPVAVDCANTALCRFCKLTHVDLNMPSDEYWGMGERERGKWIEDTIEKIRHNPMYSIQAYRERDVIENEEIADFFKKYNSKHAAPAITCPYCGHDKFQMVARKWSIWTGLLTNKVDRVCERCKRKF